MEIITKTITKAEINYTHKGDVIVQITFDDNRILYLATTQKEAMDSLLSLLVGQKVKVESREVEYNGTKREIYLFLIKQKD